MSLEERTEIRYAFKKAWEECIRCGFKNRYPRREKLIWDHKEKKCWIANWELAERVPESTQWDDIEYRKWVLSESPGEERGARVSPAT
ncbi:hypothetical protein VTN96DRAFT_4681 [Rasamsonia emersonii]